MRTRLFACVLVAASFVAAPARAVEVLRFTWDAPAECPSADAVRTAAVRNVPASAVPLEAAAVVVHRDRWSVTLRTRRADTIGERTLEAASCAALADATALILALALVPPGEDLTAASSVAPADPPSASAPAPPPAPAPAPPPAPAEDRPIDRPVRRAEGPRDPSLALGGFAATDATSLPAPALGGGASLAWTPSAVRLEALATVWSGQSRALDGSTAGARFTMASLGAGACHALLRGSFELSPCAGSSVSWVSARGFGATVNYDASARWVTFDAGLLARAPVTSWLAIRGRVDGMLPFERPRFEVENEGLVHRPPPLGMRAALGVELSFL